MKNVPSEIDAPVEGTSTVHRRHKEVKSIREYLLDGLMIFIAVALGFISENIRENAVETGRAKVFASSMADDLKADTTELTAYIKYVTYASKNIDSLLSLFLKNDLQVIPTGKLYWYGLWGGARPSFVPNDATFQQMKSSGSLRYVSSNALLKKIVYYDQLCRLSLSNEQLDNTLYGEVRKIRGQIFDYRYNMEANDIYQSNKETPDQQRIDSYILSGPPLLSHDKVLFNEYLELVRSRNFSVKLDRAKNLLANARELLKALNEEYRLE